MTGPDSGSGLAGLQGVLQTGALGAGLESSAGPACVLEALAPRLLCATAAPVTPPAGPMIKPRDPAASVTRRRQ